MKRWRPIPLKERPREVPKVEGKEPRLSPIEALQDLWWRLTRGRWKPKVGMRIEARLYDRAHRLYRRVPGWKVEIEVGRLVDVEGARVACLRGLELWAEGVWSHAHQRVQCQNCGEVLGVPVVEKSRRGRKRGEGERGGE